MDIPSNLLLLSEDGRRGFFPWLPRVTASPDGGYFAVVEFASSQMWGVPIFQYNATTGPFVVTHRQWRNIGFQPDVRLRLGIGPERTTTRLLASARFDRVTLAHLDQPTHTEEGMRRYGGVSEIAVDDLEIGSNKLIYNTNRALTAIKDRVTNAVLVRFDRAGRYDLVGSRQARRVGPIGADRVPIHMDIASDTLVLLDTANDRSKVLEIWSIKSNKKKLEISAPTVAGERTCIRQTALLPNGVLLTSFETENVPVAGGSKAAFALYRIDRPARRWVHLGPFRLSGAANSGRVLLIAGPSPGNNQYLVWPK
ncbi:MAG: hypothetical protein H0W86_07090 [Armatimonadetes bacterium]|nr:hypothetical protein [Armatimonadota bacterium]